MLARPALADSSPIKIGWLAAMTGPSSAPTQGINRGVVYAAESINAAGGVNGRKIEIVTRDTQGDPSKAVNAAQALIGREKVNAIWGPVNSGEALATSPIMARYKIPNTVSAVLDAVIDEKKYPTVFRLSPSNSQWLDAVRGYCSNILKTKKVAVIGDNTGYGVAAVKDSVASFKTAGCDVVYQANIDATQADLTPDILRMKQAGAEAIVLWSVSIGMESRLMNARASQSWDAPIVGHPSLGTGEIGKLVDKPANWDRVYMVGYRNCSFDASGKLPPTSQEFVDKVRGKIELSDTSLWWVLSGVDAVTAVADAVRATGSVAADDIVTYWNSKPFDGLFAKFAFSKTNHNGFPTSEIVMSKANTQHDGAFDIAPGYN
jgi:branched-chain amino acid transport system substrate-binding protein